MSLENAEVVVFRGANIGEIRYKLERNKKMFEKYMNFIVHVGTNDVQKLSNDQFKSAYCNLITRIKTLFPSEVIGISSILPRPVDFEKSNEKIKKVNYHRNELCNKYKVILIHSYTYFMESGKPLVELCASKDGGLHLNYEGSRQWGSPTIFTLIGGACVGRHVTALRFLTSQSLFLLACFHSKEATNTNFIVFGLTRLGLYPMDLTYSRLEC